MSAESVNFDLEGCGMCGRDVEPDEEIHTVAVTRDGEVLIGAFCSDHTPEDVRAFCSDAASRAGTITIPEWAFEDEPVDPFKVFDRRLDPEEVQALRDEVAGENSL